MNNKVLIFAIPILLLVTVGLTLTLDYSDSGEGQQIFSGSYTRTDQVQPQVLDNGCFPALTPDMEYYEVCYDKEIEDGN
jgi:hypothetical protein